VRWRAVYALAGVRGRPGNAATLREALADEEPLCRLFALRGLRALAAEGLDGGFDPTPFVDDPDGRVVIEAVTGLTRRQDAALLAELVVRHPSAHVRAVAARNLVPALGEEASDGARAAPLFALVVAATEDASPVVRREAATSLVAVAAVDGMARFMLQRLQTSPDPRDRERAAEILAEGRLREDELLGRLLDDPVPAVVAAALGAMVELPADVQRGHLMAALGRSDPAVVSAAAEASAAFLRVHPDDAHLPDALSGALERSRGFEMKEARQALRRALEQPPEEPPAPATAPEGRLLERLLAQDEAARADPRPRVRLETELGPLDLQLHRVDAPAHVASFLELAEQGFYDGLDLHRVVPNFVVQGLDPRGDGYGTGGRRLPDEFNARPYLTGTLGMPHAGEPHTGGCQIFITHLPTPHLDAGYTVFGRVVSGHDVLQALQIGDRILSVRRLDD
jgi:cyclophilin family peptidyl-prolyl cis-trans isomerase